MDPEAVKKIKGLLGEGFRQEDLERILEEDPQLAESAEALVEHFARIRQEAIPPLPQGFSERVMREVQGSKLKVQSSKSKVRGPWSTTRWLAPLAAAAVVVLGLWAAYRYWETPPVPGVHIREIAQADGASEYEVLFALQDPQAKTVVLAGDFSQWEPLPLKERDGIFWTKVRLKEGNFLYSFSIDGRQWNPGPAPQMVDDQWGGSNGLLKLL